MSNIIEITDDSKLIELLATGTIYVNGGGGGGGANLAYTASPTQGVVTSDSGTDATIPAGSATNASLMLPADKTKLDGVASGATANSTDAQLRDRLTHTGTQAISTVTGLQTALDGKQATGDYATNTALTNGLAGKADLVGGLVPANQLPSFVDDVLEYVNLASFPVTGESGKIYIALDTNQTYRWSGSIYAIVSESLALGETSSTAYRGDRGKTAYDHSQLTGNPHSTTKSDVGLANVANVDTTTTANITDSLNKRFITDAQQTVLGNTSGTNTGDNAVNSLYSGLATSKQDTLVSGTNIKTINSQSLLGSGDITISGGGGATDLAYVASSTNGVVTSSTGTSATIPAGSTTNASLMLPADKTKLDGVASGATANSTDAQLRDRATHTGTQLASTISDFASTVLATLLTGLSTATNTAILATDSVLIALGKLQAQITSLGTSKENTITSGTTSQYFRGDKTFQTLDKSAVGLSNVDNTSDLNKPISSATQTALNAKQNTITTGTISQYFRGDLSLATLDKSAVGLANVDNTSDANKPISTATQTALNAKENTLNADQKLKITISAFAPSGGVDKDVWFQYTP